MMQICPDCLSQVPSLWLWEGIGLGRSCYEQLSAGQQRKMTCQRYYELRGRVWVDGYNPGFASDRDVANLADQQRIVRFSQSRRAHRNGASS